MGFNARLTFRQHRILRVRQIWLSIGANVSGPWGTPEDSLRRAIAELERNNFVVFACSDAYLTEPLGRVRQPKFVNAVVGIRASIGPAALLRQLKRLERLAGRRVASRWGPRPLDLDIIDFGGRILGRSSARARQPLVLPHPEMQRRQFVLLPLAAVAPSWRHPQFGIGAASLLVRARRPPDARGTRNACLAGVFMSSPAQRGRHRRIVGGAP